MRPLSLLSIVLLVAAPDPRRLEVSAAAGRLSIHAVRVPLSDLLEELVRKTGVEVVFESGPARAVLVTADIKSLPEEEALAKLFERLPVSWGVTLRSDGRRVERLVVADARATRKPSPSPSPTRSPISRPQRPSAASYPAEPPTPTPTPTPDASRRRSPRPSPTVSPRPSPTVSPTPKPTARPTPRT